MRFAAVAAAWLGALLCGGLVAVSAAADDDGEYFAVCDAGSTGTRLYIFLLPPSGPTKARSVFVKKVKPGLSSYAENPTGTVAPLLKLFSQGAEKVPEGKRAALPTFIFGTAGMRLLAPEAQKAVWSALSEGLSDSPTFPFSKGGLQMRTVSGVEEGLWAVVAANFLTGRISLDLKVSGASPAVGLLDLGGSSTQIAIPPVAEASSTHIGQGATVQSYLGFGMTRIREQIRIRTTSKADAACYMKGTKLAEAGQELVGSGDATTCRQLIEAIMVEESASCTASRESESAEASCLGDLRQRAKETQTIKDGSLDFFAVSGFTYAVDFVRWWFALSPDAASGFVTTFPRPTLSELQDAVDKMCAGEWSVVEAHASNEETKHEFTGPDNTPYRCFQANYILVLLGKVYGFPADKRVLHFALEHEGEDLEWPLGALLHEREKKAAAGSEEL